MTRPGLPIRWEIEVTRPGGFTEPIELHTTFDYLHLFGISNLEPDARSSTGTPTDVVYTFDPPTGEDFIVSMDGNTEPGIHEVPPATTSLVSNGTPVVTSRTRRWWCRVCRSSSGPSCSPLHLDRDEGDGAQGAVGAVELILLIAVGDLIQQGVTGDDRSVVGAMLAVSVFDLMTLGFSYAGFRWPRLGGDGRFAGDHRQGR